MSRHLIPHEGMASPVSDTACPPSRFRIPTRNRQDCRDSLGTVLSQTVATISLSAPPTVTFSQQLAHSGQRE